MIWPKLDFIEIPPYTLAVDSVAFVADIVGDMSGGGVRGDERGQAACSRAEWPHQRVPSGALFDYYIG